MTQDVIMKSKGGHPYNESPLAIMGKYEQQFFGDLPRIDENLDIVQTLADNISNNVAKRALEQEREAVRQEKGDGAANNLTHEEAFRRLASTKEGLSSYVRMIAAELRESKVEYKEQAVLHEAVESMKMGDEACYLDCDLLSIVALHCAKRHDMPLNAYPAPKHMYIGSSRHTDFAAEMTAFRPNPGQAQDSSGAGERLILTQKEQREGQGYGKQNKALEESFGYFVPATEKDLHVQMRWIMHTVRVRNINSPEKAEQFIAEVTQILEQNRGSPTARHFRVLLWELHNQLSIYYAKRGKGGKDPKALAHMETGVRHYLQDISDYNVIGERIDMTRLNIP